jgi:3-oxoacyl-[acyl-carrier-protein] synthase II
VTGRNVVITGRGLVCPLGDRAETVFGALCDGRTAFAAPTVFPAASLPGHLTAEVRDFAAEKYLRPGNIRPLDRTGRLALVGVELALADAGWPLDLRSDQVIGLVVGTMFCSVRTIGEFDRRAMQAGPEYASPMDFSNTVLNAAAGQVAIWQRLRGVNSTVAAGAASGVQAIGYATQLIRSGREDVLVAGGAEELCFESSLGFKSAGRLAQPIDGAPGCSVPFDSRRTGALLGEGAAFLVLEAADVAAARGARVLGQIRGIANGYDPGAFARRPDEGTTLGRTIERALRDAAGAANAIGAVSASASGSPDLDRREAAAIAAVLDRRAPVTAIKAMAGEALGASGALQAIAALEALRGGRLPGIAGLACPDPAIRLDIAASTRPVDGTSALVTSITPEGNCAAIVLSIDS